MLGVFAVLVTSASYNHLLIVEVKGRSALRAQWLSDRREEWDVRAWSHSSTFVCFFVFFLYIYVHGTWPQGVLEAYSLACAQSGVTEMETNTFHSYKQSHFFELCIWCWHFSASQLTLVFIVRRQWQHFTSTNDQIKKWKMYLKNWEFPWLCSGFVQTVRQSDLFLKSNL